MKVIPVQFAPTDERELFLRVGGMPLGALLWTFMRMSQPYVVLAGLAEVIPGLMLCFRRTAMLGAALAVPVVANVFILDSFYGVPVRLFSGALLATALGLLAPEGRRLFTFFLLRRPVSAPTKGFTLPKPWMRRVAWGLKLLVPVAALVFFGRNAWERRQAFFARSMPAALYGVYDVESFVVNGVERPPLTTDASRWRRVVASRYGAYRVEYMDERQEGFRHPYDEATHHLVLASWDESSKGDFSLSWPEADLLAMQGEWNGHPTTIGLRRIPTPDFLLPKHPLPWVSEDIDF